MRSYVLAASCVISLACLREIYPLESSISTHRSAIIERYNIIVYLWGEPD